MLTTTRRLLSKVVCQWMEKTNNLRGVSWTIYGESLVLS